jgi:hypothetical protein
MAEFPTGGHVMAGVTPHLYLTDRNHYAHLREQEDVTSKVIFWFCALFPPAWLAYYLGAFDFYMAHYTRGEVKEMSADWKEAALPFGLVYGMVTVVVLVLIVYYISTS